jgi:exopolysaccharide biosynthesis WecB/TagA/CpsF family protein
MVNVAYSAAAAEPPAGTLVVDDLNLLEATRVAEQFGTSQFGYVVTANADHAIRHYSDANFRRLYADASIVLLDSRFLVHLLRIVKGQYLTACPGSDLTFRLFHDTIWPGDRIVLVGGTPDQADKLRAQFALHDLHHVNPPMKFISDPRAVNDCLEEVEAASPFRFCFLAVGSPQQEILAYKLRERGVARGLALCIGASIDYLTGAEQRAPLWMQERGLEWFWRLSHNPRRMAHRYLVRGPRLFAFLSQMRFVPRRPRLSPDIESIEETALPH